MALLHPNSTNWNKKTVLFVHGIGFQPKLYSEPLYEILRTADPAVADATRWHEIAYDEANEMMKNKIVELQKRIPGPNAEPSAMDTAADFLVDLVDYLATSSLYHWINNYARKALVEVLNEGIKDSVMPEDHDIILISHSLGTVVSYELLHNIITDPQLPGLSRGVTIRAWLTMGSPLAFIKKNQGKIPHLNPSAFIRKQPLGRPWMKDPFSGRVTNVNEWFNYRQKLDPVGSLVPLNQASVGGELTKETAVFEAFHTGINPHDFGNYITEYRTEILDLLRA